MTPHCSVFDLRQRQLCQVIGREVYRDLCEPCREHLQREPQA